MQAVVRTSLRLALATLVVLAADFAALCQTDRNPPTPQPDSPQVLAVVVGISKYPKLPGGQQLQFADRDAAAFASALQSSGVNPRNIHIVSGVDATTARIKSEIGGWLARSAREEDTVYIFFSGHAFVERDFGESYLLTYDSDTQNPYGSAVSIAELEHALARRIKAGHVIVIGDAVRRDLFDPDSDGVSASETFVKSLEGLAASRKGVTALLANGPGEFSREGQRWGGLGVFTKLLTEGLAGAADRDHDSQVTDEELFDFLATRVSQETSNKQHPWRSAPTGAPVIVAGARRTLTSPAQATPSTRQTPPRDAIARTESPVAVAKSTTPSAGVPVTPSATSGSQPSAGNQPARSSTPAAQPPVGSAPSAPSSTSPSQPRTSSEQARPASSGTQPVSIGQPTKPSSPAVASQPAATGQPARPPSTGASEPAATGQPTKPSSTGASQPAATGQPAKPSSTGASTPAGVSQPAARPPVPSGGIATPSPAAANVPSLPAGEIAIAASTPPRPSNLPPKPSVPSTVVVENKGGDSPGSSGSVAVPEATGIPSPLILQLQAAIASGNLIEPRSASAWDLYQRLVQEHSPAPELPRLKTALADAFLASGKQIVAGDVRSDNVTNRLEDFRRAGQLLSKARSLRSDDPGIAALEKLSAGEALIALQFYDEAERTLSPLQDAKIAAAQNAMGLVYLGALSDWQAERAFKRAIEIDPQWGAPHYNLGLLYKSQQKDESLAELEAAAAIEPANPAMIGALGDEYFARKQWDRAASSYRAVIKVDPKNDSWHTKLGHTLYSQGRHDEANLEYQRARELAGKSQ